MNVAVVVSLPRCGSTLTCEVLEQHPEVLGFGEIFIHNEDGRRFYHSKTAKTGQCYDGVDFAAYISSLFLLGEDARKEMLSFKLMDYQAPEVWDWIAGRPDIRIVYVRRDNLLEMVASSESCERTGAWHAHTPDDIARAGKARVAINPAALIEMQERRERLEKRLQGLKNPVFNLQYEQLTGSFYSATTQLYNWLDLSPHQAHLTQSKLHRKSMLERVQNYRQLRDHFEGTSLARHFIHE